MKKQDRMKQLQQLKRSELKDAVVKRAEELGQGFVNYELPPDEVDETEVKRSLMTTVRTFIPYTNEWYEAKAAEEEMDDLKKIRIERVKAEDFYHMSKVGKHDEALLTMLSETNYDYFYFNKLKYKMENEGKFKFEVPRENNLFLLLEKGPNKNRLRKAINQAYSLMDDKMTNELARLSNVSDGTTLLKQYTNDSPCMWRGKNKQGINFRCDNVRMPKPIVKDDQNVDGIASSSGAGNKLKKGEIECFPYCCYHVPFCISENHEAGSKNKIRIPNVEGLCAECYMMKFRKRPSPFNMETCPGITAVGSDGKELIASKDSVRSGNTPLPSASSSLTSAGNDSMNTGNQSAEGNRPQVIDREYKKYLKTRHYATPKDQPPPLILAKKYEPPEEAVTVVQKMTQLARIAIYNKKYLFEGKKSALRIQSFYRMYRLKNMHIALRYERDKSRRHRALILIQAQARRYLYSQMVKRMRILYHKSATLIQKIFRGYNCRRHLRIDWAAKRLQKFMKLLHFFKFRDSVIMVMQLRLLFIKRNKLANVIQRVYRGYSCRLFLFHQKLWKLISNALIKKIQRCYRRCLARRRVKHHISLGEVWALRQCAKKLAYMLYELYLDQQRRKELFTKLVTHAPAVQKLIRKFLAQRGTKKLKMLRQAMRDWFRPYYAMDFMQDFLRNKVVESFNVNQLANGNLFVPPEKNFIRKFLPEQYQRSWEVHYRVFDVTIKGWYDSIQQPLITSEKDAIMRKFRNPINGYILLSVLDEFIHQHPQPCRKHGRRICGDCAFRSHCTLRNCKCQEYCRNPKHKLGICLRCDHPISLHAYCPLQNKPEMSVAFAGKNKATLMQLLTFQSDADMSVPIGVIGNKLTEVLVPHLDKDDVREHKIKERKRQAKEHALYMSTIKKTNKSMQNTLTQKLLIGEIEGDQIATNRLYWKQFSLSAVDPENKDTKQLLKKQPKLKESTVVPKVKVASTVFEKVGYDQLTPEYKVVNYDKFWEIVPKNPNKNVHDYHEKFEHNLPLPVIKNDTLVYTFEGQQIYFNLLNQIIALDVQHVHSDDPLFLQLVMNHIQIFERHWRKMVVDIRTGKLNRHVHVSEQSKLIFDNANVPRPILAKKLDETFRDLGFHKKVLGKDIEIKPYAEKKDVSEYIIKANGLSGILQTTRPNSAAPRANNRSRGNSPTRQMSSTTLTKNNSFSFSQQDLQGTESLQQTTDLFNSNNNSTEPLNKAGQLSPLKRQGSFTSPKKTSEDTQRKMLLELSMTFNQRSQGNLLIDDSSSVDRLPYMRNKSLPPLGTEQRVDTPNSPMRTTRSNILTDTARTRTPSPLKKRRGSHSEAMREVTTNELREMHYTISTAPRAKNQYTAKTILQLNDDRLVCPFPACGKSFLSKESALRHMFSHEQRKRLSTSTPYQDALLQYYWPRDAPWRKLEKFNEKELPPGAVRCTVPLCGDIFSTKQRLQAHMRLVHNHCHPSSIKLNYFAYTNMLKMIPPEKPARMDWWDLPWCELHPQPIAKCPNCMEIESIDGPKPPFRIFESGAVNMKIRKEVLRSPGNTSGAGSSNKNSALQLAAVANGTLTMKHTIRISSNDKQHVVRIVANDEDCGNEALQLGEYLGRVIHLVQDRNKIAWIGVERMWKVSDLMKKVHEELSFLHEHMSSNMLIPEHILMGKDQMTAEDIIWSTLHTVSETYDMQVVSSEQEEKSLTSTNPALYLVLRDHISN